MLNYTLLKQMDLNHALATIDNENPELADLIEHLVTLGLDAQTENLNKQVSVIEEVVEERNYIIGQADEMIKTVYINLLKEMYTEFNIPKKRFRAMLGKYSIDMELQLMAEAQEFLSDSITEFNKFKRQIL